MPDDLVFELGLAYRSLASEYRDLITDIANLVAHSAELALTTIDSQVLLERIEKGMVKVRIINDRIADKCQALNK